jgi:hypothetical protein
MYLTPPRPLSSRTFQSSTRRCTWLCWDLHPRHRPQARPPATLQKMATAQNCSKHPAWSQRCCLWTGLHRRVAALPRRIHLQAGSRCTAHRIRIWVTHQRSFLGRGRGFCIRRNTGLQGAARSDHLGRCVGRSSMVCSRRSPWYRATFTRVRCRLHHAHQVLCSTTEPLSS